MSVLYSSGVINIPNVTGNIVITATATAAPVASISVAYTQSGTVYNTADLDDLKADLVVTATYEGGTTGTIASADYTLSGTLAVGTSTITVSYSGKTDTFTVTVTLDPPGLVNGTYNKLIVSNNNYLQYAASTGNFSASTVPLKYPISLQTGDAINITFSCDNPDPDMSSKKLRLHFQDGSGNMITGYYYPYPYGQQSTTMTGSASTDAIAESLYITTQTPGMDGLACTISVSVKGEVIF